MGKPMRPVPIQPIVCAFFDITKLSVQSWHDACACRGFTRSLVIAPVAGTRAIRLVRVVFGGGYSALSSWPDRPQGQRSLRGSKVCRRECGQPMQDAVTTVAVDRGAVLAGRWRLLARTLFPFIVVAAIWEIIAWAGIFPRRLFPPLEEVAASFVHLTMTGILPRHAIETIIRLLTGFALAGVVGVTIGVLMGRSRRAEDILLPLVSIGAPIPGLAYAPLFLLWFGLGNVSSVLLVGFVSAFPIIFNSWTGVKAVKEIWVRSAQAMGADDRRLFSHVILPGALPYILTGLRLGLAQAWRILVAVEMLAAV